MNINKAIWLRRDDRIVDKKTKARLRVLSIEIIHGYDLGKKKGTRDILIECVDIISGIYYRKFHTEVK